MYLRNRFFCICLISLSIANCPISSLLCQHLVLLDLKNFCLCVESHWGIYFLFLFIYFCFLGMRLQHMGVPRLGVKSELQLLTYITARPGRETASSWILVRFLTCWATAGTLHMVLIWTYLIPNEAKFVFHIINYHFGCLFIKYLFKSFVYFFFCRGPCSWHAEVPRPEIKRMQQWSLTHWATRDACLFFFLSCSSYI